MKLTKESARDFKKSESDRERKDAGSRHRDEGRQDGRSWMQIVTKPGIGR